MTDKLRLTLVTSKLSSAAGGLSSSVPALAHGLARFPDMDVTVLGTQDPRAPEEWREWGHRVEAVRVRGPAILQYAPRMQARLEALRPEVTDVQGLWTWPSAVNLRHHLRHGVPYLVTPRGMLDPWARRNSARKKAIVNALFEGRHLRNAFCLRATAEMEAEHFRRMGLRNPIAIVPNSVEIPPLEQRRERPRRQVLLLSRIHPKKGIALLLRVWSRLEGGHPDWDLIIAGPDENGHTREMQQFARRLGLTRVAFPGPVFGSEKQRLYRDSDLFVLPTHAENFGLVIAEALAQEVPVITTHNAPWQGLETEGCGWWLPLDEDRLASAMAEAMALPSARRHEIGRRGRVWVQRDFGSKAVVENMRSVYIWVARGGARPSCIETD